jgi:hypothetical protein
MTIIWSATNTRLMEYVTNTNDVESVASASLGYDTDTNFTYGVAVALVSRPGYHPDEEVREIVFYLYAINEDAGVDNRWLDGADTKPFIPDKGDRAYILAAIASLLDELIQQNAPNLVFMCTTSPNLPDEALQKYHLLCRVMTHHGYKTGQSEPYNGYKQWIFERE